MQLPKLISFAVHHAGTFYLEHERGESLSGILPSASSACVARCTTAASRCSYCAPSDTRCWDDCAGAGIGNCVAQCP